MSKSTQFEYAWCLVRSKYNDDIRKGIALLEGEVLGSPTLPFPATVRICPRLPWPRSLPPSQVLGSFFNTGAYNSHSYLPVNTCDKGCPLAWLLPVCFWLITTSSLFSQTEREHVGPRRTRAIW